LKIQSYNGSIAQKIQAAGKKYIVFTVIIELFVIQKQARSKR